MKNVLKEIDNGIIKNFYLLYGQENYLINYYAGEIKKKFIPAQVSDMNFNIFNGNAEAIINCALLLPFMNEYRLLIVKESGFFYSGKKNESEMIFNMLNDIPASSIIIFCESKIDKRNKLYKKIYDIGKTIELKKPTPKDLIKWIIKYCKANEKIISPENALLILKTTLGNMEFLKNELDKLISHANEKISPQDINLLCTKSIDAKIFDLVAAIGNKNLNAALKSYNNLLFMKEQPLMILMVIARQFSLILQVKNFYHAQPNINLIAEKLGIRNFVVSDCLKQAKNFSSDILISALKECLDIDYKIKTGQLIDKLAVETLIVKYSV